MKAIAALAAILTLGLTGCNATATLQGIDASVRQYAPIIGKDLLLVGDIVVQAECSPALAASTQTAVNVLTVIAPSSAKAQRAQTILQTNVRVAAELCPLVTAIQAKVGSVPAGVPTQTVQATGG